ncbi:MAG: glycosyltransferase family 4 protein [Candidatus Helarchaeota archaeon]
MKILVIAQTVDIHDDTLGFFVSWLEKIKLFFDKVIVISFDKIKYENSESLKLYNVKKWKFKILKILNFYKIFLKILIKDKIDLIFCHMLPEYVILSSVSVFFKNIPIFLWYSHSNVDLKLKIAFNKAKLIFTSNQGGCRLNSEKIKILNHGIDVNRFKYYFKTKDDIFKIISVGRITPSKNYETIIKAVNELIKNESIANIELKIIGTTKSNSDILYLKKLKDLVEKYNLSKYIKFVGNIEYSQINEFYNKADLLINASKNESYDKVVLEALACQIPVLTSIYSFKKFLNINNIFEKNNFKELANKIKYWYNFGKRDKNFGIKYRQLIERKFSNEYLISTMAKMMKKFVKK